MVRGFTLLELAMVTVIISLLIAAIVTGRDIINQAQIQSVIREVNEYKAAILTFELQYGGGALPGDFNNATDFFSGTGNGNGDGIIDTTGERVDFWQHLALSGIIEGTYTGVLGSGGDRYNPENMPASDYPEGYYLPLFPSDAGGTWYGITGREVGNFFYFGKRRTAYDGAPAGALLPAIEAYNLDLKMDDGLADHGVVWVLKGFLPGSGSFSSGCVANEVSGETEAGSYDFSTENPACRIWFRFKEFGQ